MAALFIIVTLAAIGAYLLTVSHGQVAAATQDEQAARAYQAARAGIEWGAYQVLIVSPPNCPGLPAPQSVNVPEQSQTYVAVVTCEVSDVETEGAQQITTYKVTATGCNVGGCAPPAPVPATYVERRLQLTLSKCTAGCQP